MTTRAFRYEHYPESIEFTRVSFEQIDRGRKGYRVVAHVAKRDDAAKVLAFLGSHFGEERSLVGVCIEMAPGGKRPFRVVGTVTNIDSAHLLQDAIKEWLKEQLGFDLETLPIMSYIRTEYHEANMPPRVEIDMTVYMDSEVQDTISDLAVNGGPVQFKGERFMIGRSEWHVLSNRFMSECSPECTLSLIGVL